MAVVVGEGGGGGIVLGVLGAGVAIFTVDYVLSEPGKSWASQIVTSLSSKWKPADKTSSVADKKEFAHREIAKRMGRPSAPRQAAPRQVAPAQARRQPIPRQPQPEAQATATNLVSKTFGGPPSSPVTKPGGADKSVQSAQRMLNTFFQAHVIDEDGKIGPHTIDALKQFQAAEKLPVTGLIDDKTYDFLTQISSPLSQTKTGQDPHYSHLVERADRSQPDWWGAAREFGSYWLLPPPISYARQMAQSHAIEDARTHTGYWTGAASSDWKSETAPLGKAAQDIIARAISEADPRTLPSLSKMLSAAGFPRAAQAAGGTGHGVTALPPPGHTSDVGPGF